MKNKSLITKILILVIIIIVIIIIVRAILNHRDRDVGIDSATQVIEDMQNATNNKIQKVSNIVDLAKVQSCIQKFYLSYCAINHPNTVSDLEQETYEPEYYKEQTLKFLSDDYKTKFNVNSSNIASEDNGISEPEIEIYDINYVTKYEGVSAYFVYGKVRDSISLKSQDFNIICLLDNNNMTFELYLDNYLDGVDFRNLKEGETIDFNIPKSVGDREVNKYGTISKTYDEFASDKFNSVRKLLLNEPEFAYSLLTDEAKAKYGSLNDFESFIKNNRKDIFLLSYGGYKLNNNDGNIVIKAYNTDNTISINFYFDSFSSFKYSIEGL